MIRYIRQNGSRYEITEAKLEHQRRQIIRRDARRRKKAKLAQLPLAAKGGE